ncbi:MAG: hypothetical protein A3K19_02540 [Lentisphaerae bacterium RIFOXYB12_FULL_65_16]|nr:MAG: hypothetical protein A3K18_21230 [Lentisphaerae bacterium RIFOXYA12_64_32]OGV93597.1 MAG: hypothetical protein A3K19_02540 [Lentisphaerae bacterium RIFOXYB12_FULL_65_16]
MDWTDAGLVLTLGDQKTTWRLEKGAWRRTCTCGYINDRCLHACATVLLFQQILKHERWGGGAAAVPGAAGTARGGLPRAATAPRDDEQGMEQLPLFGSALMTTDERPKKLEVEVDFHHEPGCATVRFYLNDGGTRGLLRMQQLLNLWGRVRHTEAFRRLWPAGDVDFLNWLGPQVRADAAMKQNLRVFKVSRDRFDTWLERWGDAPGRFLERASQAPLSLARRGADFAIELTPHEEDWVQIAALVRTPAGKRYHVHEIFKSLAEGRNDVVLDGQVLDFDWPLSREMVVEVFSRKSPRMRRQHICEHLPHLLEGRLDLLTGPLVTHRSESGTVRVEAKPDGADVLLRAFVGHTAVLPGVRLAAGRLDADGERFVVTVYDAPELAAVRSFLDQAGTPAGRDGAVRVSGTPERITALVLAWRQLPAGVTRDVTGSLAPLLDDHAVPLPQLDLREERNFVDLQVAWVRDDVRVSHHEIAEAMRAGRAVLRTRGGAWLSLDGARLRELETKVSALGFGDTERLRLFRTGAGQVVKEFAGLSGSGVAPEVRPLAERIVAEPAPVCPALPEALQAVLRPYQKDGYGFLFDRTAHRVGAILADDMGLGKTLQVLSLLEAHRCQKSRLNALVVCPASVVSVWVDEAARFCPGLCCAAYTGSAEKRALVFESGDWNLLVTNYTLARMDLERLCGRTYSHVILDEAQFIKNPESQISQAVKALKADCTLALTGTPLENRLLDLWSIMDFLNPGFLGSREAFEERYERPVRRGELAARIAPVILRRTKEAVAPELPPRTEEVIRIDLTPEERELYDMELVRARQMLKEKGPVEILAALTRLREVCCHPRLLLKQPTSVPSSKLATLMEMTREILDEGHSVLVFSQFTSMLELIDEQMQDIPTFWITGETPSTRRADVVRQFTESRDNAVFLLSLKAAGTGLTLTRADYVFIYDPWWNPAVERQAIDRTHRIGQEKPVIAYRLVCRDTVEEKVLALQAEKAEMFADVMRGAEDQAVAQRLTAMDIASLLA